MVPVNIGPAVDIVGECLARPISSLRNGIYVLLLDIGFYEAIDDGIIVRTLYEQYRTVIAGPQNCRSGQVIRFGTMGDVGRETTLTDIQ
jgi:hypothetical protein